MKFIPCDITRTNFPFWTRKTFRNPPVILVRDKICDNIYCPTLPDWIPGTKAALMHKGKLVSKKQDAYVTTAATAPCLRKWLIAKSKQHDPFLTVPWDDVTRNDINWNSVWSSFDQISKGWQFQLSKYAHNWTPTLHQWATQDNSIDRRCFACGCLKDDIDHVLQWPSDRRSDSRDKAQLQFLNHLTKYHTPAPMAKMIMRALDQWFSNLQWNLVPHLPTGPDIPNQHLDQLINKAFVHQNNIRWGHFLRGWLLLHWKLCIVEYYRYCQPGDMYNPNLWMTKTVDAVWDLFLVIWTTHNGE
jgi:hypothetical protein